MEEVDFITAVRNAERIWRYHLRGTVWGAVDARGEPIWSPFMATSLDVTDYGRQLYSALVNGEYGEPPPSQPRLRCWKEKKLSAVKKLISGATSRRVSNTWWSLMGAAGIMVSVKGNVFQPHWLSPEMDRYWAQCFLWWFSILSQFIAYCCEGWSDHLINYCTIRSSLAYQHWYLWCLFALQ